MENEQYLQMFIEETNEHLEAMNQELLKLDQHPGDIQAINEIFRAIHTIKGMAGSMQFNKMQRLAHDVENVLDALRKGEITATPDMLDLLFQCLDILQSQLESIASSGTDGDNDFTQIIDKLYAYLPANRQNTSAVEKSTPPSINQYVDNVVRVANEKGYTAYKVHIVLRPDCLLKSARAYIIFKTLEEFAETIESVPSAQDIENERFDRDFTLTILTKEPEQYIYERINSVSEIESVTVQELNEIDDKTQKTERAQQSQQDQNKSPSGGVSMEQKVSKSIRVDIERLDDFMNLASELIITRNRIEGIGIGQDNPELNEAIEYMSRLTSNLHDLVMKIRMVPIDMVFNRFPRVIRDLSRTTDKKVELVMSGNETEIDRSIVEELGDPLIHLIRNAVDHGIELPEERVKQGKPEIGTVEMRAYNDGDNVVVEVKDDGAGIDVAKVAGKAIGKGLVDEDQVKEMSDEDIISFLFQPGFSTSDVITDISGRGVGLDVVKTKIESLGGTVDVRSELGKGTRFIIRMPLTLSIIQALLVMVGSEIYAIPLNSIIEIIDVSADDIKSIRRQQEVIDFRSSLIPFVRLKQVLNVLDNEQDVHGTITTVIVRKGDKIAGFAVDTLIDQEDIVIKPLGKYLSHIKSISGATILGNGQIAFILDINHLL
ncbi:MAG: two-component system, chemotaxis family, sensor kinase CheA [Clostridiales bacterium]|nr:two-component system, chemotaxis family, sensor kinase CheA [Clostridiales bacterium]